MPGLRQTGLISSHSYFASPNGLATTIGNIALGGTCTFKETAQPPLPGNLQRLPPDYSPKLVTVTLSGECCQETRVLNQAHPCCTPTKALSREAVSDERRSKQRRKVSARRVNRR